VGIDFENYTLYSPFARTLFNTTATDFTVEYYTNIKTAFPTYCSIGVIVDGAYTKTLTAATDNIIQHGSVSGLATGDKQIELVYGLQSKPTTTVLGTFVRKVLVSGRVATSVTPTTPTNQMIIYGDSISVGANSTTPTSEAWAMLVRSSYTGNLAIEGHGYRTLYEDANTAGLLSAFVSKLSGGFGNVDIIWLCIGTNDYGLQKWSSTDFGTAYSSLLDALHVAFPTATIYAHTPLTRSPETELHAGYGDLPAYRTKISDAQSSRSDWCTLVDGTAISPVLDVDNLHPTTAGHITVANQIKTVLGLT